MDRENHIASQVALEEEMQIDAVPPRAENVPRIYELRGIQVKFPHKANQIQKDIMDKVLSEVIAGRNLITEAATGTGKTLALLCPLLAWLDNQTIREENMAEFSPSKRQKLSPPLIIYATKTLAHTKHIIGQLRLLYSNTPMGILASVKQTCNNEEADEHLCEFCPNKLAWSDHANCQPIKTWDLEDLKDFSRNNETCSYNEMMNANKNAKIVFCTYNYLLHPGVRQALNISLDGNILVFDEGHNVEDLCREIASTPTNFFTLTNVKEITEILQRALATPKLADNDREHVRNLANTFQKFSHYLRYQLIVLAKNNGSDLSVSFDDILPELTALGLGPEHLDQLKKDISVLKQCSSAVSLRSDRSEFRSKTKIIRYLSNAVDVLAFLWERNSMEFLNKNFFDISLRRPVLLQNPHAENISDCKNDHSEKNIELKLICLKPAVAFKCTTEARSVIVASATFSPIETTALELGLECTSQLSANHVTPPERVFAALVNCHANNRLNLELTSPCWEDYEADYQDQVAKIIQGICHVVPHGVVVFMPTKQRIERLMSIWRQNGHLNTMKNLKEVFVEPNEKVQVGLNAILQQYKLHAETERGAILFAVMRGRLSDGVEFRDNQARALVTIGIPFGPIDDPSVKAKRAYQDVIVPPKGGWAWYSSNAFKAFNQTLGRNIRHSQDWGAIFLVDSRWAREDYFDQLPLWATNSLVSGNVGSSMDDLIPDFTQFVNSRLV